MTPTAPAPRCHLLIGMPGSGKTTFAHRWQQHDPMIVIVSTDTVRQQLYGDPREQGQWLEIRAELLRQIQHALDRDRPIVYDATNAHRHHRHAIVCDIQQLACKSPIALHGWRLATPIGICQRRNQNRSRRVPPDVITQMDETLRDLPPQLSEGFLSLKPVPTIDNRPDSPPDFDAIERIISDCLNGS